MSLKSLSARLSIILVTAGFLAGCEETSKQPAEPMQSSARAPDKPDAKTGESAMPLTIMSPAFTANAKIPVRFTADGEDVSPQLSWSGVPDSAKELALICDDPDAPRADPWVHWVIYRIPAATTTLPEGVARTESLSAPAGALQGKNSWNQIGYRGPAPPPGHGVHHYHFKLYALDTTLELLPGADKEQLLAAIKGHILAQCELVGTYQR